MLNLKKLLGVYSKDRCLRESLDKYLRLVKGKPKISENLLLPWRAVYKRCRLQPKFAS